MSNYYKIKNLVNCEIDKIANRSELNESSLSNLYKLVDVLKDVTEVEEKEMGMNDFGGMNYRNSYGRNWNDYGYSGNNYGGGQGNSFRGYSMNDNKGVVIQHLEQAMQAAQNDHERDAIRELMNKMNNM